MSQWNNDPLLRNSLIITVTIMVIIAAFALINVYYGLYTKFPSSFEDFFVSPVTNWNITQASLFASFVVIISNIRFIRTHLTPWRLSVERRLSNNGERTKNLEEFFGIFVKNDSSEKHPIELDHGERSNFKKRPWAENIALVSNIATVIALVILIIAIIDNKTVIEKLEEQLNESKTTTDLLTTIITNAYVDYKPNLVFLISPINATYKIGSSLHQFALDSYNYGQNWSLVNMTWDFGGHGCLNGAEIINLPTISNTNQVFIKKSDSDIAQIQVPPQFENVKNLTSFSVKLSILEYPFDPALGKISQYKKFNWVFFTFDYNSTYQVWFPHYASDIQAPCLKSSQSDFYVQLNTSDNSMYSYDLVR